MRFITGALVVLAGSMLWGVGALAVSWAYAAGGNRNAGETATYGGMVIVAAGGLILFLAHRDDPPPF
jgi:hypothetical protein